jgi:hypothetical protein
MTTCPGPMPEYAIPASVTFAAAAIKAGQSKRSEEAHGQTIAGVSLDSSVDAVRKWVEHCHWAGETVSKQH